MTLQEEMAQAHDRDYAQRRYMHDLREEILSFLRENPSRCHRFTRETLQHAEKQLWEDMLRIDRTWN